jgi:hypothetical protein
MGLTTERKIFFGLALVAGASLVVDQAFLSPSGASAASLDADQIASMPSEPIIASLAKPITKSVTEILNDRLSKASEGLSSDIQLDAQASELQRMFAPLVKPAPKPEVQQPVRPTQTEVEPTVPTQSIPTNMPSLSAVMPSQSGQSGAILNGTLYRVGETTPEGYRLLKVNQRQALVEYNTQQFWLTLPAFKD